MKVILMEDVEGLGKVGDMLKVADGYARNYLIPKKLAIMATPRKVKQLEHQKQVAEDKAKRTVSDAELLARRLESLSLTIPAKVGEEDKLYGSVTTMDIIAAMEKEGLEIDRRKIQLEEPIKTTGVFTVEVKLMPEVTARMKIWVVRE